MDAPSKEKLLQERREYKKAKAEENKQQSRPAIAQEKNIIPNNDVEFDSDLFKPGDPDSDDEGEFYTSVVFLYYIIKIS
jgi:hypothetical protein